MPKLRLFARYFALTIFLGAFTFQVHDIYTQYQAQMTTTAIEYEENDRLSLPAISFCAERPYKNLTAMPIGSCRSGRPLRRPSPSWSMAVWEPQTATAMWS